jgi:hypothetical protein
MAFLIWLLSNCTCNFSVVFDNLALSFRRLVLRAWSFVLGAPYLVRTLSISVGGGTGGTQNRQRRQLKDIAEV